MLYAQNGDRIVAVDSVTSLHPMYTTRYRPLAITVMLYKHTADVCHYSRSEHIHACKLNWTWTSRPTYTKRLLDTHISLAAEKLGRLVLIQFWTRVGLLQCGRSHWSSRLEFSSVQLMCCEQTFSVHISVQRKAAFTPQCNAASYPV